MRIHRRVPNFVSVSCFTAVALLSVRMPAQEGFRGGFGDFVRSLDANRNGLLDPDEAQGRARDLVVRLAQGAGLDLSRPIPMDRLMQEAQRLRDAGSLGPFGPPPGGPFPGSPPPSGASPSGSTPVASATGSAASTSSSGSRSSPSAPGSGRPEERLVPGFGIESELMPALGFGKASPASTTMPTAGLKVTDADTREAQESISRYDRNGDGVLTVDETRDGRWRDDPWLWDKNGDGKLTLVEMSFRYAKRRVDREASSSSSSSSGSSGSGSSNSNSSSSSSPTSPPGGGPPGWPGGWGGGFVWGATPSQPGDHRMIAYVFGRYDRNRSGVFEKDEWSSFNTDPSPADTDRDGKITRDEMNKWLAKQYPTGEPPRDSNRDSGRDGGRDGSRDGSRDSGRPDFGRFGRSDSGRSGTTGKTATKSDRKSYRFAEATERLPKGLPDWFARNDANADAQIAMAEYSSSWNEQLAVEFSKFDKNGDGIITAAECLDATKAGVQRGK